MIRDWQVGIIITLAVYILLDIIALFGTTKSSRWPLLPWMVRDTKKQTRISFKKNFRENTYYLHLLDSGIHSNTHHGGDYCDCNYNLGCLHGRFTRHELHDCCSNYFDDAYGYVKF